MRAVPLSDNLADKSSQAKAQSEVGALYAEIAERLLEVREKAGEQHAAGFIYKAFIIWRANHKALWVLMHLMTGDLSEITRSYTTMGKEDARTKQAVQQEWERILAAIKPHYPELVNAIVQLRSISAKLQGEEECKVI